MDRVIYINNHLIKLEGAYNVRELGGYKTSNGSYTLEGVFIRGDCTHCLTQNDINILKNRGLTMVIDLRSCTEVKQKPSKFIECKGIKYKNIEMFDGIHNDIVEENFPKSLFDLYISLIDNSKDKYAEIFHLFSQNEGLILFNCTAGKDRTGLLSMLLLCMAGVDKNTIVDDYAISQYNMKYLLEKQKESLKNIPKHMFNSDPKDMYATINYLENKYVNVENYLATCGISMSELNILKKRFVN